MEIQSITLLLLVTLAVVLGQRASCKEKADIALVIQNPKDQSIGDGLYDFLDGIKSKLIERQSCYRMTTIVAGKEPQIAIGLRCGYSSKGRCYRNGLRKLRQELGKSPRVSDLAKAADFLPNKVFTASNGARKLAKKKVILILTSPPNTGAMSPEDAVKDLHDYGIKIITVAVGKATDQNLRKISLSDKGTFRVRDASRLGAPELAQRISSFVKGEVTTVPRVAGLMGTSEDGVPFESMGSPVKVPLSLKEADFKEQCNYFADIAFLVDSSGSVADEYDKEKFFVRRMAAKFNISEEGSHGGVIIFSSKGYVTLSIKLNQYTRLRDFNDAVENLYFYGYQTRIDLALDLANDELFTIKNGMRPTLKQVLILLTDGRQNPITNVTTGATLNPAVNAKALHNRNIQMFAIGIGKRINVTELEKITGSKETVYSVNNFDDLISDDFVKKVSAKLCQPGQLGNGTEPPLTSRPLTTALPPSKPPCQHTQKPCCDRGPVYINVFNGQYTTVYQGAGKSKTDEKTMDLFLGIPHKKVDPQERIEFLVKTLFPDRQDLLDALKKLVSTKTRPPPAAGSLAMRVGRKKRSITYDQYMEAVATRGRQQKYAALNGWGNFFHLFEAELMRRLLSQGKAVNVTLLAPHDGAFQKAGQRVEAFKRNLRAQGLGTYLVKPLDKYGMYWKPLKGDHILRTYMDVSSEKKGTLVMENSKILNKYYSTDKIPIVMLDSALNLPKENILVIMKRMPHLSLFVGLLQRSGILDIMAEPPVLTEVCVDANKCLVMNEERKSRLEAMSKAKQLTIFALSNEAILRVDKSKMKELLKSRENLMKAVGSHVVIGSVFSRAVNPKIGSLSPSLSQGNAVFLLTRATTSSPLMYTDYLKTKMAEVQQVDIRGKDAILHTVDKFFGD